MPKFERQVEIEAPVETVWAVITNPQQWPFWFPGIEAVSNVSEVKPGELSNGKMKVAPGSVRLSALSPMNGWRL